MSNHVATYPPDEQYQRWRDEADEMDMSLSEWVQGMVEAGMKNFSTNIEPDENIQELREQRNDLRQELSDARGRIRALETALYEGEREAIVEYIENNPGVQYDEIIQHVINSTPERVVRQLDVLDGDRIVRDGDAYYPMEDE